MNQHIPESQRHRALLLQLAADDGDKSVLLAYVNLLGIVALGWKLSIEPNADANHFDGRLSSPSGARAVRGSADTVAMLARELVHRWMGGTAPLNREVGARRVAPLALQLATDAVRRRVEPAAPSFGPHAPTFDKPPPLSAFMEPRCDCGLQLGRVSGLETLVCVRCDAEQLEALAADARKIGG